MISQQNSPSLTRVISLSHAKSKLFKSPSKLKKKINLNNKFLLKLKILKVTVFNKNLRLSRSMLKLSRSLQPLLLVELTSSEKTMKMDKSLTSVLSELESQRRTPSLSRTMVNIQLSTTSPERRSSPEKSSPSSQKQMSSNQGQKRSSLSDSFLREKSR